MQKVTYKSIYLNLYDFYEIDAINLTKNFLGSKSELNLKFKNNYVISLTFDFENKNMNLNILKEARDKIESLYQREFQNINKFILSQLIIQLNNIDLADMQASHKILLNIFDTIDNIDEKSYNFSDDVNANKFDNEVQLIDEPEIIIPSNKIKSNTPHIKIGSSEFDLSKYNRQISYINDNINAKYKPKSIEVNSLSMANVESITQSQSSDDIDYIMNYNNILSMNSLDESIVDNIFKEIIFRITIVTLTSGLILVFNASFMINILAIALVLCISFSISKKIDMIDKNIHQLEIYKGLTNQQYDIINQILLNDDGVAFRMYDFIDAQHTTKEYIAFDIQDMTLVDFDDESYQFYNDTCLFKELSYDEIDDRLKTIHDVKEDKDTIQKEKELKKKIDHQSKLNSKINSDIINQLPFYSSLDNINKELYSEKMDSVEETSQLIEENIKLENNLSEKIDFSNLSKNKENLEIQMLPYGRNALFASKFNNEFDSDFKQKLYFSDIDNNIFEKSELTNNLKNESITTSIIPFETLYECDKTLKGND